MIITGKASTVSLGGTQLVPLGEYTLKITQESEDYDTLDSAVKSRIATFRNWTVEVKLKGTLPARSYGTVTAGAWTGTFLKSWKASLKGDVSDAPQQADEWMTQVFSGFDWSIEASKFVDSSTKNVFLQAVAASAGVVTVRTPVLIGNCIYGDSESTADSKPQEERLTFQGTGLPSTGTYYTALVNTFLGYGTQLLAQRYVAPQAIVIGNVLSGLGYLTDLDIDSDGKVLDISIKLTGTGEPTLL